VDQFWNLVKERSASLDGRSGVVRFGLVASFDPSAYAARVMMQPENVLSGWLPVMTIWMGNGWGMAAPLVPGTQVVVVPQEGDAEHGIIIGATWSNVDRPLGAPAGELWIQHENGNFLKLMNDGTISLSAPTVKISGNLVVTGDISDQGGSHGTVAMFRSDYDQHVHSVPQGGVTGLASETL